METENRLLRRQEVETRCGLSRSSIYALMDSDRFPRPLKIGPRSVRWQSDEIGRGKLSDTTINKERKEIGMTDDLLARLEDINRELQNLHAGKIEDTTLPVQKQIELKWKEFDRLREMARRGRLGWSA